MAHRKQLRINYFIENRMENNKEQERKANNKVNFAVDDGEKIRVSDENSLPELSEKTSH